TTITMMTMPRADVVIVILLRALDYPASAGHASGCESAGAAFAGEQGAARRLARVGPGSRGRFPEMKGHVMKIGRLLIRLVVGGLFIGHGSQKLFGWFGGPGPEGTDRMRYKIAMPPARRRAFAAGLPEPAGGALLAAGLATPLAAASLTGVMLTAIRKVHAENGIWNTRGGFEYNL